MSSAEMSVAGFWLAQGSTYNGFTCPADAKYPCFVQYGAAIPVTGSFSASLAGFSPQSSTSSATIAVTQTNSSTAIPANGGDVSVTNQGSSTIYYNFTVGAGTASVTTSNTLVAGATAGIHLPAGATFINTIADTGNTSTVKIVGGTGLVTGYGGGSSGGGSGGNVNVSQIAGTTTSVNNGTADAGTLRVTVASNSTGTIAATQSGTWNVTNVSGTVSLPTGAATSANQSTEITALNTVNTNLTNVTGTKNAGTAAANSELVGAVYNSTPLTLTNTQQASLQSDANGFLKVNVAAGGASGGTSSSFAAAFPSTGTAIGASDGTNMQSLLVDSNKNLKVIGGYAQGSTTSGQTAALISGAVTTSAPTYTTAQTSPLSLDTAGSLRVNVTSATGVAQGSTTSGQTISPVGGRTLSATPTDTTAQTNMPVLDLNGSQAVQPYGLLDNCVSGCITSAMTGTTSTSLIAAPGSASLRNYITQITISNTHATVGTNLELQDGSGGTTFYIIPAAAVYGGATLTFTKPLKQPTLNTALYIKNTTTGASTFASASGFKAP